MAMDKWCTFVVVAALHRARANQSKCISYKSNMVNMIPFLKIARKAYFGHQWGQRCNRTSESLSKLEDDFNWNYRKWGDGQNWLSYVAIFKCYKCTEKIFVRTYLHKFHWQQGAWNPKGGTVTRRDKQGKGRSGGAIPKGSSLGYWAGVVDPPGLCTASCRYESYGFHLPA